LEPLTRALARRRASLPPGLQVHIHRVREIAAELAPHHHVDPVRAGLGALAHDVARAVPDRELLEQAARFGLPVGVVEQRVPVLLHGPVGAELLRREDGLDDAPLYQAVYWHTTGHPSLDRLGQVVFLADKLDPEKIGRYPYQPRLRELAFTDLDRAVLEFTTRELAFRLGRGEMVHPTMVETRNHLLAAVSRG
jgi:predicted HD superfamily hydrolase involved in NAD metabolism